MSSWPWVPSWATWAPTLLFFALLCDRQPSWISLSIHCMSCLCHSAMMKWSDASRIEFKGAGATAGLDTASWPVNNVTHIELDWCSWPCVNADMLHTWQTTCDPRDKGWVVTQTGAAASWHAQRSLVCEMIPRAGLRQRASGRCRLPVTAAVAVAAAVVAAAAGPCAQWWNLSLTAKIIS